MPVTCVNGSQIDYSDVGTGLPIVFIPGLAGSKNWFHFQTSGLSDRYRIISYDLRRAHGRSEHALQIHAADLDGLLRSLKISSAVIAGYSLGGLIALDFAANHPDRCLGLILSSVSPSLPQLTNDEIIEDLLPGDVKFDSFFAKLWKRIFGAKQEPVDESDLLAYLAQQRANFDQFTLEARLNLLRTSVITQNLEEIEAPTLIIAGAEEKPYILSGAQQMEEQIECSTLEIIENQDHYYFYTRHDIYNQIIADFIARRVTGF